MRTQILDAIIDLFIDLFTPFKKALRLFYVSREMSSSILKVHRAPRKEKAKIKKTAEISHIEDMTDLFVPTVYSVSSEMKEIPHRTCA